MKVFIFTAVKISVYCMGVFLSWQRGKTKVAFAVGNPVNKTFSCVPSLYGYGRNKGDNAKSILPGGFKPASNFILLNVPMRYFCGRFYCFMSLCLFYFIFFFFCCWRLMHVIIF